MKAALALMFVCIAGTAQAEDKPGLLLYFSQQTTQFVQVGVPPVESVWVDRIDGAKNAAHQVLAPFFSSINDCDGMNQSDLIAKVKPKLSYGPSGGVFNAEIRVEFKLGDGRHVGTLKAFGHHAGYIDSVYAEDSAHMAIDAAMQSIAEQYAADSQLQERIRAGLATDLKRVPCGMVGLEPSR
jgi:hypothetical protein